jgi:glycine/D-amino acid oxidase-like deaminating enzyme
MASTLILENPANETARVENLIPDGAIVIGGSMGGLVAARALSNHYRQVILIEQDRIGKTFENRRGVPQGKHAHGLLARGLNRPGSVLSRPVQRTPECRRSPGEGDARNALVL